MVKLSVVVAIYNVEKYVKKCIESLLDETNDEYELILVDDGSKDNSAAICDSYSNHKNIKVIHQENSGVSVARNTGIENSTGKWITFVDGDDFVDKGFIKEIINSIDNIDTDMIVFNYNAFYDSNRVFKCRMIPFDGNQYVSDKKDLFQKRMISQYYKGGDKSTVVSSGTTWCKVIKKDILETNNVRFKPGLIKAQDTVFWLNATEFADKIYYLDKCLYNYRLSSGSISSGKRYIKNSVDEFDNLIFEYSKFIEKYDKDQSYIEAFNLRCIQVLMWNIDHNFFNKKNDKKLTDKTNELKDLIERKNYSRAIDNVDKENLPTRLKVLLRYMRNKKLKRYFVVYNNYNFLSNIKNGRK
ncbi:MAG: glycosyltransferase [Tissierellia bacterium]|nr:glycosyltransferase [Tissierellia bacterium]